MDSFDASRRLGGGSFRRRVAAPQRVGDGEAAVCMAPAPAPDAEAAVLPRGPGAPFSATAAGSLRLQPCRQRAGGLVGDGVDDLRRYGDPGILALHAADDLLTGDAVDAFARCVGHVPDIRNFGDGLFACGDDVAANRVLGLVVRTLGDSDLLALYGGGELDLKLLGDSFRARR